jgi:hypothetical protein
MVQISIIVCLGAPVFWAERLIKGIPLNVGTSEDLSVFDM